jgi:hypothetical protein
MSKKLFVVLHMIQPYIPLGDNVVDHTLKQCDIAVDNGADGVCIIAGKLGITIHQLNEAARLIKVKYPKTFVVINYLIDPSFSMRMLPHYVDGIWTDQGVDGRGFQKDVIETSCVRRRMDWNGIWFTGFFHKGGDLRQPENEKLKILTDDLLELHQSVIPTTTGLGTGIPADISSIQRLYKMIDGRKKMAIASGITIENVSSYLPYIEYFFVGTGVEKKSNHNTHVGFLDAHSIKQLSSIIHHYK